MPLLNISNEWKNEIAQLKSQLVADGIIVSRWKHEQTLYLIARNVYPDAIFQHRPIWLEPQNLDIYIPSINIGIEYQGIQHYEPIVFFGGEEGLIHRQKLDARKKVSVKNSLKLIEWKYTDDISKKSFLKRITEIIRSQ